MNPANREATIDKSGNSEQAAYTWMRGAQGGILLLLISYQHFSALLRDDLSSSERLVEQTYIGVTIYHELMVR